MWGSVGVCVGGLKVIFGTFGTVWVCVGVCGCVWVCVGVCGGFSMTRKLDAVGNFFHIQLFHFPFLLSGVIREGSPYIKVKVFAQVLAIGPI